MDTQKKNQTKNIGFVLLATIFGFALGYMLLALIPNDLGSASFYAVPIVLFILLFAYWLQITIHELGHLLFGLLTGYSFVSFRVGRYMWIRKEGKLTFATLNIPGTGGQCLMDPPAYNNGDYPYLLYNLGGVLINFLVAIGSLFLINERYVFFINALFISLTLTGVIAAATNAYPIKISGIPTDGYNISAIYTDATVKQAFWLQLKGNALLSEGAEPKDLPLEGFEVTDADQLTYPLITSIQLFKYNYYLDQMAFEKAEETLNELVPYLEELVPIYQSEIKMQLIFLELIGENNPAVVDQHFDVALHQHLERTSNWINRKRFLMAYEWFHNQNKDKALDHYRQLQEQAPNYHNAGEAKMELKLGAWLKEQIDSSTKDFTTLE